MRPLTLKGGDRNTTLIGMTEDMRDDLFKALHQDQWTEYHFELSNGTKFSIVSNAPDTQGVSPNAAFQNWIVRTSNYTVESFVEYMMSKHHMHGHFAFTKEQWDRANTD